MRTAFALSTRMRGRSALKTAERSRDLRLQHTNTLGNFLVGDLEGSRCFGAPFPGLAAQIEVWERCQGAVEIGHFPSESLALPETRATSLTIVETPG